MQRAVVVEYPNWSKRFTFQWPSDGIDPALSTRPPILVKLTCASPYRVLTRWHIFKFNLTILPYSHALYMHYCLRALLFLFFIFGGRCLSINSPSITPLSSITTHHHYLHCCYPGPRLLFATQFPAHSTRANKYCVNVRYEMNEVYDWRFDTAEAVSSRHL